MVGWSGLGIYAAFCAAGGCLHFQFGSRKRLLAANAAAATPPTTAGPQAQVQATSTAVTTALPQLPHLNLSLPAKFSTASTLLAGGALLVARQSKNAVQTAGWGLATLLFLPLNLTGVEVLPPTLFGSLIPPAVRKLGTFLCVSSATVVGLVALRRFHSDSTAFVLVSALGSVPLALEVGDYVLCHREVVEKRLRATVARWTSGDAGTLTCLDSYLNDLIASLLNQRSDNRTGPFNAAAVKKICREEHRKHAVELRQALGDDLRAEGLPENIQILGAHTVERLIGVTLRSSRCVDAILDAVNKHEGQLSSIEVNAVRTQLQVSVLQGLQNEAASAMRFASMLKSAVGF